MSGWCHGCWRDLSHSCDDIAGLAVTIAKRVCDLAGPTQVLVSYTMKELLVGSGIPLTDHGSHTLKGVPDQWLLFAAKA